jgi:hypothetical protein
MRQNAEAHVFKASSPPGVVLVLVISVGIPLIEASAPVSGYAAETLDINTATADGLKGTAGHW